MAVPKKRTSKSKKNARKANWKKKADKQAQKALSLAKSVLRGQTTSFIYTYLVYKKTRTKSCPEARKLRLKYTKK